MKTYDTLPRGSLVQFRQFRGTGIVAKCPEHPGQPYYCAWCPNNDTGDIVAFQASDVTAAGPQVGTIRLHAAKVRA